MTIYSDIGLSVHVGGSLFTAQAGFEPFVITDMLSGYSHQVDAYGGYRTATMNISLSMAEAEDWLENGLMRHIMVYNDSAAIIWEGFVNSIGLSMGGLQIRRGPVLNLSNKIQVSYTPLDISVSPPVSGNETKTPVANNLPSQALYGILFEQVSGGSLTDANALQLRDTYLDEHKDPELTQTFDAFGSASISITVDCVGYIEYLERYNYLIASTATQTVTAKILAILAANPNIAVFSTNYEKIATNAMLVPVQDEKEESGGSLIKGLVALGNSSSDRYLFGLYAGRKYQYGAVPTAFDYSIHMSTGEIHQFGSEIQVMPWDILPGKFAFYNDFMVGLGTVPIIPDKLDPRVQLIESLTFTAPFGVTLSGGKFDKLGQKIAKLGLSGAWA